MISVVINTLNESNHLKRAISSISHFADEIIVVDMHSSDGSAELAKKLGAKVFEHEKMDFVELARNFGIGKASGDWILVLDPDEELTPKLISLLKEKLEEDKFDYFRLPRKNLVFGKWLKHSRWWPDYNIRFFKKGKVSWNELIHSVPITNGEGTDLPAVEENAIVHHHYETISQFINRLDRYTTAQASQKKSEGHEIRWNDLLTKPSQEFLSRFFLGQAYKDGIHGLALSLLQAFSELITYLKVWELGKFEKQNLVLPKAVEQMRTIERDFHYWQADANFRESGGVINRIKRKFKLP